MTKQIKIKIILFFLLLILAQISFSFVKYNSEYFPLDISGKKLAVLNSLRNDNYNGKFNDLIFLLFDDDGKFKERFLSLTKNIADDDKIKKSQTDEEKADHILQLLHQLLLRKYIENDPRLSETFNLGYYNCVSSTVIYNMLCEYFNIKTSAVVVPKHIFSNVHINDKKYDAETTVKFGFNPGQNRNITDEFKRITGFVYVPLSSGPRENISNLQLVSYLYSQTGNYLGMQKLFIKSLSQFVYSLLIFPTNKSGIEGLKLTYYQLALKAQNEKKYFYSINLMRELAKLLLQDEGSQRASQHHYNNIILELIKTNNFNQAFEIINKYKDDRDFTDINSKIIPEVYISFSNFLIKNNKFNEAIELIEKQSANYPILKDAIPVFYNNWIIGLINKKDYVNALQVAQKALKFDEKFIRQITIIYSNYITDNINNGNLENAHQIVKEFLSKFPLNNDSKKLFIQFIRFYTSILVKNNKIEQAIKLIEDEKQNLIEKDYFELKEHIIFVSCENNLKSLDFKLSVDFFISGVKQFKNSIKFKDFIEKYSIRLVSFAYQNNKLDNVLSFLKKIESEIGKSYMNEALALFYYYKGIFEHNQKQFYKAMDYIKEGLKIQKTNYLIELLKSTLLNRSNSLILQNKIEETLIIAENSCLISDNNIIILNIFRNIILNIARYYNNENKKDFALNVLKRGLKILRDDREILSLIENINR